MEDMIKKVLCLMLITMTCARTYVAENIKNDSEKLEAAKKPYEERTHGEPIIRVACCLSVSAC